MGNCCLKGKMVDSPEKIKEKKFDILLIALVDGIWDVKAQVMAMGIPVEKIVLGLGWSAVDYWPEPSLDMIFEIEKHAFIPFTKAPADIYRHYVGETTLAHNRREREDFFDKYCQGEWLDVGYGGDIIVPECAGWDLRNGDAQYLNGIPDESFDFVYSSYCIEYMDNVRVALQNWFRVVRHGGYLLLYLPHRDLYEKQRVLLSRFNPHHKHMFLIGRSELPDTLDIAG